jgi:hypothetical protein
MPTAEEVRTWAYDEDAWLVDQDEDLVFLAPKYVPLLVELIADDQCPKRAVALRYPRHTTKHLLERGARGDKSGLATLKTTAGAVDESAAEELRSWAGHVLARIAEIE